MLSLILNRDTRDSHDDDDDGHALAWIAPPPRGRRDERVAVYRDGYPARLREALEESHPAVLHLVGPSASNALVRRYIASLSRHSYNLNDVGAEFCDFLEHDPLRAALPFLPELARLEWAIVRAFHACDGPPLDGTRLATLTAAQWQSAVLRFQPSLAVLRSNWPLLSLWQARDVPLADIDIDVENRSQCVLVRRRGTAIHCDLVSDGEASVLQALLGGTRLGELGSLLAAGDGQVADVSAWFSRWMEQGLVADLA